MKYIELFSNKYPSFTPIYVNQGLIGDCWLIASLLALSINENGKDLLKEVFFINEDNTYTIKLYDNKRKSVYLNIIPKFRTDIDDNNNINFYYSGNNHYNIPYLFGINPDTELIWAPIIEKAFSKYTGSIRKLEGNHAYNAFTTLTNKDVKKINAFCLSKRFIEKFTKDFNAGLICAVIETKSNSVDDKFTENHAYCLYKIIDGNWYLHNPHKHFDNLTNCAVMTQTEIIKNVSLITYINF